MDAADRGTSPALLTPTDVRRLLDAYGLAPRRTSGQNFVVDPNTVRKIVRDAGVTSDDVVLEVGAGLGSLTLALASAARRVVAVEIDAGLVRALGETVGALSNVEVMHADALRSDLGALAGEDVRLVANLPYNIATPLVAHALDDPRVRDLYVMVQREVGERWAARPGHPLYAGISVRLALVAQVTVVATVPRSVFFPAPNVDSVTVRIERRPLDFGGLDIEAVTAVVHTAFAQRRKTLRNALGARLPQTRVDAALDAAGIAPSTRAEELAVDDFLRLTRALADAPTGVVA